MADAMIRSMFLVAGILIEVLGVEEIKSNRPSWQDC